MAVSFKDYYETLGVSRDATPDQIKSAYRKLARKHHPDNPSMKGNPDAENKIKEINEAYEVLKDPEKRRKYDQLGANWDQADFGAQGGGAGGGFGGGAGFEGFGRGRRGGTRDFHFSGTGFSDFFEQFFGGGAGGAFGGFGDFDDIRGGARTRGPQPKGSDLESDIMVSLEEVARGATRPVSLRWRNPETGREETRKYQVRIPVGIREGKRLRLSGKGHPGPGGSGDLYLRVRIAPHPDFRVEGDAVLYDLDLAPWEAALGTTVEIPTLDGKVRLNVPAGTSGGKRLRLRGRGLPNPDNPDRKGDLHAVVHIRVPESPTEAERKLWEQLAEQSDFRPRKT